MFIAAISSSVSSFLLSVCLNRASTSSILWSFCCDAPKKETSSAAVWYCTPGLDTTDAYATLTWAQEKEEINVPASELELKLNSNFIYKAHFMHKM